MKSKFSVLSLLLLIVVSTQTAFANDTLENLVWKAVSRNPAEFAAATEELRSMGPYGLWVLRLRYRNEIKLHVDDPTLKPDEEWQRISKALDAVSGQKNSYISGLYWYTDLAKAQRVATESGKPILSLRLLGKLSDELSCANSRFFRTVLYSNSEIAAVLRGRFVLHWESVRPVPIITVDFGDGRKIERTVDGNSIHYVLDSSGQLLEAFPGLYGPQAFLRGLADAEGLFESVKGKVGPERNTVLWQYYRTQTNKVNIAWYQDTTKIGGKAPEGFRIQTTKDGKIDAIVVAPPPVTGSAIDLDGLGALSRTQRKLGQITDEAKWPQIAQLHASDAVLDQTSIGLMQQQHWDFRGEQFTKMVQNFQELIALDTVRNEYLLHMKLYPWLMESAQRPDLGGLERLTAIVYSGLFFTSPSDAWIGLSASGTYFGIDNGGVQYKP